MRLCEFRECAEKLRAVRQGHSHEGGKHALAPASRDPLFPTCGKQAISETGLIISSGCSGSHKDAEIFTCAPLAEPGP